MTGWIPLIATLFLIFNMRKSYKLAANNSFLQAKIAELKERERRLEISEIETIKYVNYVEQGDKSLYTPLSEETELILCRMDSKMRNWEKSQLSMEERFALVEEQMPKRSLQSVLQPVQMDNVSLSFLDKLGVKNLSNDRVETFEQIALELDVVTPVKKSLTETNGVHSLMVSIVTKHGDDIASVLDLKTGIEYVIQHEKLENYITDNLLLIQMNVCNGIKTATRIWPGIQEQVI